MKKDDSAIDRYEQMAAKLSTPEARRQYEFAKRITDYANRPKGQLPDWYAPQPKPEPRYAVFHAALRSAQQDLLRLRYAMQRGDPIAEATFVARIRHIQADARRLWLPLVLGQAKTVKRRRPRLRLARS